MAGINMNKSSTEYTRQEETEQKYRKRGAWLARRFEKAAGVSAIEDPMGLIQWMEGQKSEWGRSTWRQYKASALIYLEDNHCDGAADQLRDIDVEGCKAPAHRLEAGDQKTASQKQKKVSPEEELAITNGFEAKKQFFWSLPSLIFLKAGIAVGLRPCEWPGADLLAEIVVDGETIPGPILKVKNAKDTNERAHGAFRHLVLSSLDDMDMTMVKNQLARAKKPRGPDGSISYEEYFKSCQGALYRVTKALWPRRRKRPTLYSARHQFSANLKAGGFRRDEIAAVMGHATDETASAHYGRRSAGRGGRGLVKPIQPEVARVRRMGSFTGPTAKPRG